MRLKSSGRRDRHAGMLVPGSTGRCMPDDQQGPQRERAGAQATYRVNAPRQRSPVAFFVLDSPILPVWVVGEALMSC